MDMIKNLGEPYSGDSKFVAKCRKLQSIYRADLGLAIRPYKGRDGVHYYGNYIEGGEKSGANFLADYIFEYAKYRVYMADIDAFSHFESFLAALTWMLTKNILFTKSIASGICTPYTFCQGYVVIFRDQHLCIETSVYEI